MHQHICNEQETALQQSEDKIIVGEGNQENYKPMSVEVLRPGGNWILSVHNEFAFQISHCPFCGLALPL